jgi:hypothetical protein
METSVLSYLTARPSRNLMVVRNQAITRAWWERRQDFDLYISVFVLDEAGMGDAAAVGARLRKLRGIAEIKVISAVVEMADGLYCQSSISVQNRGPNPVVRIRAARNLHSAAADSGVGHEERSDSRGDPQDS